jgi:hypothetical protein
METHETSGEPAAEVGREPANEPLLRAYLAGRDVPCPSCGYDLRDLVASTCPECGAPLALTVVTRPKRLDAYTIGLVGLTLAVLLAAVFAAVTILDRPLAGLLGGFAVYWLGRETLRWRRNRLPLAALPRHAKQERVVLCWLAALVLFVLVISRG